MAWDCVERRAASLFRQLGFVVSDHPLPFIVFPLLFTAAMGVGLLHLNPLSDAVYLFTPLGAQSKMERMAIHEKWPLTDNNYIPGRAVTQSREVHVTALARNDSNILDSKFANAVYQLDKYIQTRLALHQISFLQIHSVLESVYSTTGTTTVTKICVYSIKVSVLCQFFSNSNFPDGGCPSNKHVHILSDLYNHGFNISYPYFRFGSE